MSTQNHPLDRAAECFTGGRVAFALAMGVTPSAIGNWKKRGVPLERCLSIEQLTRGKVTRLELCPLWQSIWPELADSEPNTSQTPDPQAQAATKTVAQGVSHA